jgi:hypothetical protein
MRAPDARQRSPRLACCGVLLSLAWISPAIAQPPAIPEPLAPWVGWVLDSHPDLACPLVDGQRFCAWPGRLALELEDDGGMFRLDVVALSLPLWVWRLLMLLWALWLASRLLRWLPWCWGRLNLGPLFAGPKGFASWRGRETVDDGATADPSSGDTSSTCRSRG